MAVLYTSSRLTIYSAYGLQATAMETYIDEIFGGKIASTITCLNCNSKSELQESFLDLSLPIPVEKVIYLLSALHVSITTNYIYLYVHTSGTHDKGRNMKYNAHMLIGFYTL